MLKAALGKILQQMEKAQEEMKKMQDELEEYHVQGSAGGGMVKVEANAKKEIIQIKFDSEALTIDDLEMIEELTVAAVNQALEKADVMAKEKMQEVSGGLFANLPEGLSLPGLLN